MLTTGITWIRSWVEDMTGYQDNGRMDDQEIEEVLTKSDLNIWKTSEYYVGRVYFYNTIQEKYIFWLILVKWTPTWAACAPLTGSLSAPPSSVMSCQLKQNKNIADLQHNIRGFLEEIFFFLCSIILSLRPTNLDCCCNDSIILIFIMVMMMMMMNTQ